MRDVAVRAGRAVAVPDDGARLEVVDPSVAERIYDTDALHDAVLGGRHALQAERADTAVLGKRFAAEHELLPDLRAQWIEASDRSVELRPRRDDRTPHQPLLDDAIEVAGGSRRIGNLVRVRPERKGALHQEERIHGTRQRRRARAAGDGRRDHDAAEAVSHEMESRRRRVGLKSGEQRVCPRLADLAGAILHLPERKLAQRT
jgi:hypothetical protein